MAPKPAASRSTPDYDSESRNEHSGQNDVHWDAGNGDDERHDAMAGGDRRRRSQIGVEDRFDVNHGVGMGGKGVDGCPYLCNSGRVICIGIGNGEDERDVRAIYMADHRL